MKTPTFVAAGDGLFFTGIKQHTADANIQIYQITMRSKCVPARDPGQILTWKWQFQTKIASLPSRSAGSADSNP